MVRGARVGLVLGLLALFIPAVAHAQTALAGVVKDTSGGVLPGVLVEATSPVLIEGTKSVSTDESGQFRIIDLRPGVYTVTFSLTGFQSVKLEKVEVEGDITRTVNAELRLGTVAEALTVSGTAPVVDVSNAVRITSLEKQMLDNLPVGNNVWEMAQIIPAIDIYADGIRRASSVAGSAGAVQTYMSVNGGEARNNVVMVDGMTVSGLEADGTVQAYFNQDMNSEISYQTSGISADRSGGGVTVNMIPREGGNRYSGDGKFSFKPNGWIASNTTQRIKDMGLNSESSLRFLADGSASEGGPILRNKLWFFGSFHQFSTSDFSPNVFKDNGEQFSADQRIRQGSGRLTYQVTPRVKLTGYYDKTQKLEEGRSLGPFDDPETGLWTLKSPDYATGNGKVTATLTSRLLLEGGYSMNREYRDERNVEGLAAERYSPQWFEIVNKQTLSGAQNTAGWANAVKNYPGRDNYQASVSYVTGAHQVKAGMQWQTGTHYHSNDTNGDLWSYYQVQTKASCPGGTFGCANRDLVPDPNGFEYKLTVPWFITAWNTPVQSTERLAKDIGIYAQDSWRLRRLTINAGLRWEHLNAQNDQACTTEGRWSFNRCINGVTNVPDWYDWAPRFNTVWDVFGDARTAVKYSLNRYNYGASTGLAAAFNTMSVASRNLLWTDKNGNDTPDGSPGFVYNADGTVAGYGAGFCTTAMYSDPLNPCELNMSSLLNAQGIMFGSPAAEQQYQGYPRRWIFEQIFEVQHAVTRRLSMTFSFTRGDYKDQTKTVSPLIQEGDYVPMTIYNPVDGTPITRYSVKDLATQTRLNNSAANLTYVEPENVYVPKTLALEFRMRPYAGAQIFGGFTAQRFDARNCESSIPGIVVNPNTLRFCDDWNLAQVDDHGVFDSLRTDFTPTTPTIDPGGTMPWSKDFRMGVSLPLPWYGINLGVSYLNNDEGGLTMAYNVVYSTTGFNPATCLGGATRYPDGNAGACVGAATDPVVQGVSRNQKIASQFTTPACPATYGCVPGAVVAPGFIGGVGGTSFTVDLLPGGATTRNKRERLNQLDLKVSKTFRFGNISVLPTLEVGNLFNQDKITGYTSANYGTNDGTYLVPSLLLQSRIVGAGVQVRW
jgi:hypothetical protein